jgi:hypothetical protein
MRIYTISSMAFAAVAVLSSSSAGAAPRLTLHRFTTVHGTICQPLDSSQSISANAAGVFNTSTTTTAQLFCAIPMSTRMKISRLAADPDADCHLLSTPQRPWVEVYDRSAAADVQCSLFVMDAFNTLSGLFTVRSQGQQFAHQKLTFPVPLTDITNKILFVSCFLPPKEADVSFVARFGFPTCENDIP